MKYLLYLTLLSLFALNGRAQVVGTCEPAEAEAYLDVNNVRASIFNSGALFWQRGPGVYEVPKGSGINASFSTNIWIGGMVENELRVAAARYGNQQFWPGPLDNKGYPPEDCSIYDHIYEITQKDIAEYNQLGLLSDNLRDWPWQLGAPIIDGDGILDNYNLEGGDRPELLGDQLLWWVMNDAGNEHVSPGSNSPPIGMEVHASAFAFNRSALSQHTTFYRYKLLHKGQAPLNDAYFGLWVNIDLGNFGDDYVGSDSLLHMGFAYNSDNDDEEERSGYGTAPPAIGYTFLQTALANNDGRDNDYDGFIDEPDEQQGMSGLMRPGDGGGVNKTPQIAQDYYYYMQALWKDGSPATVGGHGYKTSNTPTKYMLSGDPVTGAFWSMRNIDGQGTPDGPGDYPIILSSGPFTMQPGDSQEIIFAIVWSRGKDHLDSVRQLKSDVRTLHENAEQILTTTTFPEVLPSQPNPVLGFAQNYPNPFSETTTIRYSLPKQAQVRLTIYDVLGREIATLVETEDKAGIHAVEFDASELAIGLYLARLQVDSFTFTKKLVLAH